MNPAQFPPTVAAIPPAFSLAYLQNVDERRRECGQVQLNHTPEDNWTARMAITCAISPWKETWPAFKAHPITFSLYTAVGRPIIAVISLIQEIYSFFIAIGKALKEQKFKNAALATRQMIPRLITLPLFGCPIFGDFLLQPAVDLIFIVEDLFKTYVLRIPLHVNVEETAAHLSGAVSSPIQT